MGQDLRWMTCYTAFWYLTSFWLRMVRAFEIVPEYRWRITFVSISCFAEYYTIVAVRNWRLEPLALSLRICNCIGAIYNFKWVELSFRVVGRCLLVTFDGFERIFHNLACDCLLVDFLVVRCNHCQLEWGDVTIVLVSIKSLCRFLVHFCVR